MRKQGREAVLLGLRCGVSLCPPSSLPAGTVLGAWGGPGTRCVLSGVKVTVGNRDSLSRAALASGGLLGKHWFLKRSPVPGLPRGQLCCPVLTALKLASVLTVSCGLAPQKTGHVRRVSPSSEARRASLHVLVVTYSVAHNGEAAAPLSSVCACTHVFWRRF